MNRKRSIDEIDEDEGKNEPKSKKNKSKGGGGGEKIFYHYKRGGNTDETFKSNFPLPTSSNRTKKWLPYSIEIRNSMNEKLNYKCNTSHTQKLVLTACVNLKTLSLNREDWNALKQINIYSCTNLNCLRFKGDFVGCILAAYGCKNIRYFVGDASCFRRIDFPEHNFGGLLNATYIGEKRLTFNQMVCMETEHLKDTMAALIQAGRRIRLGLVDELGWNPYWMDKNFFAMIIKRMVEDVKNKK